MNDLSFRLMLDNLSLKSIFWFKLIKNIRQVQQKYKTYNEVAHSYAQPKNMQNKAIYIFFLNFSAVGIQDR